VATRSLHSDDGAWIPHHLAPVLAALRFLQPSSNHSGLSLSSRQDEGPEQFLPALRYCLLPHATLLNIRPTPPRGPCEDSRRPLFPSSPCVLDGFRSRWYQSGVNIILIFAGHHRLPTASQIQSVAEGGPGLPPIRRFDEAPVPSLATACARSSPHPPRPPRALRLPRPFRCPLLSKPSCAFSPVGGGSRVFTTSRDYVGTSLGTARPITEAVGKVYGGSCGQKG
jgi:hypothetical protein